MIDTRQLLRLPSGTAGTYYWLPHLEKSGLAALPRLPVSLRILLESVLRHHDGRPARGQCDYSAVFDVELGEIGDVDDLAEQRRPLMPVRLALSSRTQPQRGGPPGRGARTPQPTASLRGCR